MNRVLFSLAAAALGLVLSIGSAMADDCDRPLDPCCKKCCKKECCAPKCCQQKCCEPCVEKVCKPVPAKKVTECVSYSCKCEDYCLKCCPPIHLHHHLHLRDHLCALLCHDHCCHNNCCEAKPCCDTCQQCQACDKVRTRNVLIKTITLVEEDTYECKPVVAECCKGAAPALPAGEKLPTPGNGKGDK